MQLPVVSYDSLLKLFHQDVYGLPLFSLLMFAGTGAFMGGWYWKRGTKVETKIVPSSKAAHIQPAEEFASGTPGVPSIHEEAPPLGLNGDGDSDLLEDRLITALARAPWKVKEGSEIALAKNEVNKKWGIATNKITFVLERDGEEARPTIPAEPIPPDPDAEEATA